MRYPMNYLSDSEIRKSFICCDCDLDGVVTIPEQCEKLLGKSIVVTNGFVPGSLLICSLSDFMKIKERFDLLNPFDIQVERLNRLIVEEAHQCDLDSYNRLIIPSRLLDRICVTPGDSICMFIFEDSLILCSKSLYDLSTQ